MGKYDAYRRIKKVKEPDKPWEEEQRKYQEEIEAEQKRALRELLDFDWFNHECTAPKAAWKPVQIFMPNESETPFERKKRMINQLSLTCGACSMCELGRKRAEKNNTLRDPHVLSNCNPTRFMVIGQNPGWDELKERQPFVGAAGKNFDNEIAKHGLSREDFYICNTVRCWTPSNAKPNEEHKERCEPFLKMEIQLIRPLLVIALGAVAFSQLCPGVNYGESLKSITTSERYGVKVFPIYHPSPLNFRGTGRKEAFEDQIKLMCKLVKRLKDA
jgi:DNA polymerase